ncbi:alpha/beta hydrolase [Terrimonas pollutisoli]|uniref:alpha/beta hydrolase n=1 Tax=Terrimonas pollutisoli TaxID=3034147 RepID=UPI0023EDEFC0|nr:alpha/beta hydrolase [Terrimonas sp. H1YJ31]
MQKRFFLFCSMMISTLVIHAQEVIPLYNDSVPNSIRSSLQEVADTGRDGITRISKVTKPTLTVYTPPAGKANGTAVIICPGGGYGILAFNHEGINVAKVFTEWGVTAFVLKYRLPNDAIMTDKTIGPLQDAQRATQLVRERSAEWNINPKHVGIMGFSAGGHLASTAATHFDKSYINNSSKTKLRPDFAILVYPVISFSNEITHMGSRNNLLGPNPTADQIKLFSNELQVTKKTPPTFLVHAKDDKGVPLENSLTFIRALEKAKVAHDSFFYEKGGHGFGLNNSTSDINWMDKVKSWMMKNKWL